MELIRIFNNLSKNDVSIAGGKGASLGEMTQAGIPVPEGFVILSEAFERFIKESELTAEIQSELDKVNHEEIHTVENASEIIKERIMQKEIPKDISKEIICEFNNLGSKFVAVRSSATSEDSATAAWAGQLESYLNTTKENLLKNVKKCWASLFTPRAIFYRFEKNLHKEKVSVAVVVQKMVESEKSGIAFSVHPVTQDYNQLIIEAGFGLGEAIVSGQVTPDSYVVDKSDMNIIETKVNEQTKGLYRKSESGGNEWKELGEKGKNQVLNDKEIIQLSNLIVKIERHYGFPVDVEWAFSGEKFYIVQSRPITTLEKMEEINKDRDEYFVYLERDFSLGLIEVNSVEGDLNKKPWIKENTPFFPYCFFIRKNNLIQYIFSKKGVEWVKEQINQRNLDNPDYYKYIIKKMKETVAPIIDILDNEKTLEINQLSNFVKISKKAWDWFEAHWWNIYLFEDQGKKKELEYLLKERKRYANFAPAINNVIRKTILKAYPKYERYVDVISVDEAISGKIPELNILKKRLNGFIYVNHKLILDKSETEIEKEYNLAIQKSEFDPNISEIKGNMAYKGKVRGNVKILKINKNMEKMEKGDILVAPTTMPDLMPAIKKAGAIVADEGGMLSHAAIISRELKIPCIVGTKIATQVLHDGDLVEVDADNGVVRIIERSNQVNEYDYILNKDWMFLVGRPYSLFGTSLYQRWFDAPQIIDLYGISIPNNLYVEEHPNVVRRYVIKQQLDNFTSSIKDIVMNNRVKCKGILKKGLKLNEEAKKYIEKSPFNDLSSSVNFLVELALHATVFSYFSYPILKEINDKELLEIVKKLRAISYYPQVVEKIINPLAKKEVGEDFNFMTLFEIMAKDRSKAEARKDANSQGKRFVFSKIDEKESVFYIENIEKIIGRLEKIEISDSVKGQTAFPGKIEGRVRLVLSSDINIEFNIGDILVAVTSNPVLMPLIKRAGAIVTNEGGVTSHAAIVSRELKIPCIIGTKFATHTFHDGDLVEVDADNGVVRILEKHK